MYVNECLNYKINGYERCKKGHIYWNIFKRFVSFGFHGIQRNNQKNNKSKSQLTDKLIFCQQVKKLDSNGVWSFIVVLTTPWDPRKWVTLWNILSFSVRNCWHAQTPTTTPTTVNYFNVFTAAVNIWNPSIPPATLEHTKPWFQDAHSKMCGTQIYGNIISSLFYTQIFVRSVIEMKVDRQ